MSVRTRVTQFCQKYRVLIAGALLIGSTHWMWLKLQDNPRLVPPHERKGLPIVEGFKKLSEIAVEKYAEYSKPKKQ